MRLTYGILVLLAAVFGREVLAADSDTLFVEIVGSERQKVLQDNDYFLKKHLYEARRYKLVSVNVDLLRAEKPFTLALFDGRKITVVPDSLVTTSNGRILRFNGHVKGTTASMNSIEEGLPQEAAALLNSRLFGISITAALYEYRPDKNQNVPFFSTVPRNNGQSATPGSGSSLVFDDSTFYGLNMDLFDATTQAEYSLRLLEMGGPHHVLVEIDPEKKVVPGPHDDMSDPDMAQKRRDKAEYFDSLGEDPRITRERQEILERLEGGKEEKARNERNTKT